MAITVLAVAFLLMMLAIAFLGYRFVIRKGSAPAELPTERCAICRNTFNKSELILRQIGDYKLLYFCRSCIESLNSESKARYN